MTAQHTPGPWTVIDNNWEVSTVYGAGGEVAMCRIDPEVTEETQDRLERIKESNARLIASAPALLLLARRLEVALPGDLPALIAEARAAIAKATD